MIANKTASPRALKTQVAAVSVGIVAGDEMVDLCDQEDSCAEVDFNVVMTVEGEPFSCESMDRLIDLARNGISQLLKIQKEML